MRRGDLMRDGLKIPCGQNIGKSLDKGKERGAFLSSSAQERRANLAPSFFRWIGSDLGKVERWKCLLRHGDLRGWKEHPVNHLADDMRHQNMCLLNARRILAVGDLQQIIYFFS